MEHKIGIDKITEFTNHAVKSELRDREEHFAVGKVVLRFLAICSQNIFIKLTLENGNITYILLLIRKTHVILRTSIVIFILSIAKLFT